MRHGKKVKSLGRTSSHRKSMMANMANSLILHKRITTTLPKAKALRTYIEPLITKSKNDTTHSRRTVFSYLKNKETVGILFREISEKVATRPGGYTRIIKLENRKGDNAEIAFIELVDYNEVYGASEKTEKKATRRRGGRKKASLQENVEETNVEATEEISTSEEAPVEPEVEEVATPEENKEAADSKEESSEEEK